MNDNASAEHAPRRVYIKKPDVHWVAEIGNRLVRRSEMAVHDDVKERNLARARAALALAERIEAEMKPKPETDFGVLALTPEDGLILWLARSLETSHDGSIDLSDGQWQVESHRTYLMGQD